MDDHDTLLLVMVAHPNPFDPPPLLVLAFDFRPSFFLLTGSPGSAPPEFTEEFLVKHGAAKGSRVIMTPSGYMTTQAMDEIAEAMVQGIREMPVIKEHPDWWFFLSGDGFKAHIKSTKFQEVAYAHKGLHAIEEGHTSHINQAFDDLEARLGKKDMRIDIGRVSRYLWKPVMTQYDLVHVGLSGLRAAAQRRSWKQSFVNVNMHPHHRRSFKDWLKKIKEDLDKGAEFEDEPDTSLYDLLPAWYHNWPVEDKDAGLKIVADHDGDWGRVELVEALVAGTPLQMDQLTDYFVCHQATVDHRTAPVPQAAPTLDPAAGAASIPVPASTVTSATAEHLAPAAAAAPGAAATTAAAATTTPSAPSAAATTTTTTTGSSADATPSFARNQDLPPQLTQFMWKPPGMKGEELFLHMAQKTRREMLPRKVVYDWERNLGRYDLAIHPDQPSMLQPSHLDLTEGSLMAEARPGLQSRKRAVRRRDGFGIQGQCMFANAPATLKRLRSAADLAVSISEVAHKKAKRTDDKDRLATEEALALAPKAEGKLHAACLAANHDFQANPRVPAALMMTLTVGQMEAIAASLRIKTKGKKKEDKMLDFTAQAAALVPRYVPRPCVAVAPAPGPSAAPSPQAPPPPITPCPN